MSRSATNAYALVVSMLMLVPVPAVGADTTLRYGPWLRAAYDLHAANFSKFTDVGFCCPSDFGQQTGTTFGLGGLLRFAPLPSVSRRLFLETRLGVAITSATLSSTESTLFNDPTNGENSSVEASFDYVIAPSWTSAMVELLPSYNLVSGLTVHAGVRTTVLLADSYEQREEISSPFAEQGFIFTDTQSATRNVASGSIPGRSTLQWSAVVGLSWEFPLNAEGTILLAPEVFGALGLNQVSDGVSHANGMAGGWSVASLSGGISLRFAPVPTVTPDPCDTIIDGRLVPKGCPDGQMLSIDLEQGTCICTDTATVVDSVVVRIDAVRLDNDPARTGGSGVVVESFIGRHWIPVLPLVFFGARQTRLDLSDVYRDVSPQQRMTFDVEPSFQREVHGHVLNIIGKRLFEHPQASVQIIGYYAEDDAETTAMAQERAFAVRDYLYQRWGVSFERMTVTSGNRRLLAPDAAASEGRCVEIRTVDAEILDPVEMPATSVRIHPPTLTVQATIQPGAGRSVASVTYSLKVGGGSGRRPKPLAETFNIGDPGFDGAMRGWTASISDPDGPLMAAVRGQLDATDLVLLPSLDVTFSSGQRIAAEQDRRQTSIPITMLSPQAKARDGLADTVFLTFDLHDASTLERLLNNVPRSAIATLAAHSVAQQNLASDVREVLVRSGFTVVDGPRSGPEIVAPMEEMSATYARAIRVMFRIPRGG